VEEKEGYEKGSYFKHKFFNSKMLKMLEKEQKMSKFEAEMALTLVSDQENLHEI